MPSSKPPKHSTRTARNSASNVPCYYLSGSALKQEFHCSNSPSSEQLCRAIESGRMWWKLHRLIDATFDIACRRRNAISSRKDLYHFANLFADASWQNADELKEDRYWKSKIQQQVAQVVFPNKSYWMDDMTIEKMWEKFRLPDTTFDWETSSSRITLANFRESSAIGKWEYTLFTTFRIWKKASDMELPWFESETPLIATGTVRDLIQIEFLDNPGALDGWDVEVRIQRREVYFERILRDADITMLTAPRKWPLLWADYIEKCEGNRDLVVRCLVGLLCLWAKAIWIFDLFLPYMLVIFRVSPLLVAVAALIASLQNIGVGGRTLGICGVVAAGVTIVLLLMEHLPKIFSALVKVWEVTIFRVLGLLPECRMLREVKDQLDRLDQCRCRDKMSCSQLETDGTNSKGNSIESIA